MSDLISRSALLESLIACDELKGRRAVEAVAKVIKEAPEVDSVAVMHGHWDYKNYTWACDRCGCHPYKGFVPAIPTFKFCPECGAEMKHRTQTSIPSNMIKRLVEEGIMSKEEIEKIFFGKEGE